MSRRRWRGPNNPTAAARAVWAACFPREAWPRGWRVTWVGFMRGAAGLTVWARREILISYADALRARRRGRRGPVEILCHEFIHVRCPDLRHGAEFLRLENGLRARCGFEPLAT